MDISLDFWPIDSEMPDSKYIPTFITKQSNKKKTKVNDKSKSNSGNKNLSKDVIIDNRARLYTISKEPVGYGKLDARGRIYFSSKNPALSIRNRLNKRLFASVSQDPFTNPIPSSYVRQSNKPFIVILSLRDLDDLNTISGKIKSYLPINISYIVFIKLRYFSDNFCMCGKQFGFDFKSEDQITWLFYIVNNRITGSFEAYNMIPDDIVYIQMSFRKLDVKLLSDFILDK